MYSLVLFMYPNLLLNYKFIRVWAHSISTFISISKTVTRAEGIKDTGWVNNGTAEKCLHHLGLRPPHGSFFTCTSPPVGMITAPQLGGLHFLLRMYSLLPILLLSLLSLAKKQLVVVIAVSLLVLVIANTQHLLCLVLS